MHKTLALPSAVSLVVSSMVGVGVFTSVGFQLLGLPSGFVILMLWAVGGVVSLAGALCYAELIAMMPRSGGEYHILREAYHPMAGFLAGWISITAGFAAPIAAVSMAFSKYAHTLGLNAVSQSMMAAVLILSIAAIHLGTLRLIGAFLTTATGFKVGLILTFLAGALLWAPRDGPSLAPQAGDLALMLSPDFAISLVYVMFAYLGWNGAAYVASEVRDPQRNVPLAFLLGILVVMGLYLLLNAVFLYSAPWDALRGQVEVGLIAAQLIFGESGGRLMGGLIALCIVSTVAGLTWAGSRVAQRIGQDFEALGILAGENRWGAPVAALALQTALSLTMVFSGSFDEVINYLMCQLITCSILAVLAVVVMRWRYPQLPRPFKVPWYPLPPVLFIGVSSWMLAFQISARPEETAWSLITLLTGAAIYALLFIRRRPRG